MILVQGPAGSVISANQGRDAEREAAVYRDQSYKIYFALAIIAMFIERWVSYLK